MSVRHLVPVLFLAACWGSPSGPKPPERPAGTPPAWKGETLGETSASRVIQLDRAPATWALPPTNQAPGVAGGHKYSTGNWEERSGPKGKYYAAKLPFSLNPGDRRDADEQIEVEIDEVHEATFSKEDPGFTGEYTWRLMGDEIILNVPTKPFEVDIEHVGANKAVQKVDWGSAQEAGRTAEDFTRYTLNLKAMTREGLLLPAPGSGTWSLTLPEGARLDMYLGMVTVPGVPASDGAEVVVTIDGAEVQRAAVPSTTEKFIPFHVDLSTWGGKQVALAIRTEAGASNISDYVFLGAPAIVGRADPSSLRHVFVIGIDTTRPDHFGVNGYPRDTTPELDAWSKDAVIFDRAWTSAPRTRPSFRAATTGRLPLDAVCAKNIGEVFQDHGWATAGIVSNIHLSPHFDFEQGFDLWWLDGKALVDDQVERAIDWLKENEGRDTYMFLHVMDPHIFYRAPDAFVKRFSDDLPPLGPDEKLPNMFNRWQVYKWMKEGKLSDAKKAHIEAEYDAELAYTSAELAKLLAKIEKLPGKSLVIIHNDHGEEFWEHGGFEHNHTLYNDVTGGLLWVKPPGGTGGVQARSPYPATLQDIAPTAFDFAGIADPPPTDGVSLLGAIRGTADAGWTRPIPIGHIQYDASRWGVVWKDHKYVLTTGSGVEELYDQLRDPGEHDNLAGTVDTTEWWKQLGAAHKLDDIGHGWRITVDVPPGRELSFALPQKARWADVLDPELVSKHPANQEWGERPKKLPEDVGVVTLSPDGMTLTFKAGKKGDGILTVLFGEAPVAPGGTVAAGKGEPTPVTVEALKVGDASVQVAAGVVFIPPKPEHVRMQECGGALTSSAEQDAELCRLGYKSGPECAPYLGGKGAPQDAD